MSVGEDLMLRKVCGQCTHTLAEVSKMSYVDCKRRTNSQSKISPQSRINGVSLCSCNKISKSVYRHVQTPRAREDSHVVKKLLDVVVIGGSDPTLARICRERLC